MVLCLVDNNWKAYAKYFSNFANTLIINEEICSDALSFNNNFSISLNNAIRLKLKSHSLETVNKWVTKIIPKNSYIFQDTTQKSINEFMSFICPIYITKPNNFDHLVNISTEIKKIEKTFNIKIKILYFYSTYLLQRYISEYNSLQPLYINPVNFIRYVKDYNRNKEYEIKELKNYDIKIATINDLLYQFDLQTIKKIEYYFQTKCNKKFIKPLQLNHNKIKNWEQLFNSLSNTEFYNYLK